MSSRQPASRPGPTPPVAGPAARQRKNKRQPHDSRYDHAALESTWRTEWERRAVYRVDIDHAPRPYYNLMMFPYPSAEGLHVGNMYAYVGADVHGRFQAMHGYDVFEPMGFDAFGIHSENYAIKGGTHPAITTPRSVANFRAQLERIGNRLDWSHVIDSSQPDYYRWTQWIFIQLFKAGLVERKSGRVNWCPRDRTVLADEQVIDGRCERCGTAVEQRELEQWWLKITAYADRLLAGLDTLDWSNRVKAAQRNWIGRSEGAIVRFPIAAEEPASERVSRNDTPHDSANRNSGKNGNIAPLETTVHERNSGKNGNSFAMPHASRNRNSGKNGNTDSSTATLPSQSQRSEAAGEGIAVFTTRPDTIYGATFIAISPDHPLVAKLTTPAQRAAVEAVRAFARPASPSDEPGTAGAATGTYAVHPFTGERMPVWVAEYVLAEYGTGAVMGVPAHDSRDHAFARAHNLPIRSVVAQAATELEPPDTTTSALTEPGTVIRSGQFTGMSSAAASQAISDELERRGIGRREVRYHLRDWLISRQRYWGPPIPIIWCPEHGAVPVPLSDLPVLLPAVDDYTPRSTGDSPLASVPSFVETTCPVCGRPARRDTDVSDNFLDSAWYYLRYPSSDNRTTAWDPTRTRKWLPVDMYIGGAEHSVLHLMYARFITMALHDIGLLDFDEPFNRFRAHGILTKEGAKISKSAGNIINPDAYVSRYGADTFRLYLLFMGPYASGGDFRDTGIGSTHRFLERIWRLVTERVAADADADAGSADPDARRMMHATIRRVQQDTAALKYNTAIASIMSWVKALEARPNITHAEASTLVRLLAPYTPFITEELWQRLGEPFSVHQQPWPALDPAALATTQVRIPVQVDGHLRDTIDVPTGLDSDEVAQRAYASTRTSRAIAGRPVIRIVYVPDRLINLVTAG